MRTALFLVVAALLTITASAIAHAQENAAGAPDLASIRAMMDDARYEDAIAAARHAIERPGLRARDYDACLDMLATAQLAVRDTRGATQTLTTLYGRDPGHRLADPDPSPVVQAAFARARASAHAPTVTLAPLADSGSGPATVVVRCDAGAELVDELRLSYRTRGETAFEQVVMTIGADGTARTRIPRDDSIAGEYVVEYFVQASAPSQTMLASIGSAESPLTLDVAARPITLAVAGSGEGPVAPATHGGGNVFGEAWFWTVVAIVVAAGLGVGAYFLFGPPSDGPSQGTLGMTVLR